MPTGVYVRTTEGLLNLFLAHIGRNNSRGCGKNQRVGKIESQGYIWVYFPDHHLANSSGWVKQSKVVMEQILGRELLPEEVVDHKSKIKNDDRPENLQLFANRVEHTRFHAKNGDHFKPGCGIRAENWTPELRQQHSRVMKEARAELARQGRARIGGKVCV